MPTTQRESYQEFWDSYLLEHQNTLNRGLHFLGTTLAIATAVSLAYLQLWWWVPLSIPIGYSFAWFGHFFVEHNRPATLRAPLWAFVSDYRMWWKMLNGSLLCDLERARKKQAAVPVEKYRKAA